jgi:hypothetical protein
MLVIPHRFKKIGLHKLVVRRIFSDILLVLGLKKVETHWYMICGCTGFGRHWAILYNRKFLTA